MAAYTFGSEATSLQEALDECVGWVFKAKADMIESVLKTLARIHGWDETEEGLPKIKRKLANRVTIETMLGSDDVTIYFDGLPFYRVTVERSGLSISVVGEPVRGIGDGDATNEHD